MFVLALPRYQVIEQQESFSSTTQSDVLNKQYFKPVYYGKDSKPCQCSACVGAIAAIITPVSIYFYVYLIWKCIYFDFFICSTYVCGYFYSC